MRRRVLIALATGTWVRGAIAATPPGRLPRVALVWTAVPASSMAGINPADPYTRAIIDGLRELGVVEGRDIVIERRSAEGDPARFDALMREMVSLDVDVIVTWADAVGAAHRATQRIAIVGVMGDPVEAGLAKTFAHPGGNVTGIAEIGVDSMSKSLQLLSEAVPSVRRVAVLASPAGLADTRAIEELSSRARTMLGLELRWFAADTPESLNAALRSILRDRAHAVMYVGNSFYFAHRHQIADWAIEQRLPAIGHRDSAVLLDQGWDLVAVAHDLARFVKRILDGAPPAEIPFEQPTRYVLTVNLRTARAIGVELPRSLLLRADEVIE